MGTYSETLDRLYNLRGGMIDLRLDRMLARRVDASDVVQDVLIRASQRLGEYLRNPVLPFDAWIRQIARDAMIDEHRRHRNAARRTVRGEHSRSLATCAGPRMSRAYCKNVRSISFDGRPRWPVFAS